MFASLKICGTVLPQNTACSRSRLNNVRSSTDVWTPTSSIAIKIARRKSHRGNQKAAMKHTARLREEADPDLASAASSDVAHEPLDAEASAGCFSVAMCVLVVIVLERATDSAAPAAPAQEGPVRGKIAECTRGESPQTRALVQVARKKWNAWPRPAILGCDDYKKRAWSGPVHALYGGAVHCRLAARNEAA